MAGIRHRVGSANHGDSADRISKLYDEILGKVLSYLPTKEAVRTCVLSKRWEHVWELTSQIDFDDSLLFDYERSNGEGCTVKCRLFKEYVDKVLFCHGGSTLQKCNMFFCSDRVASNIYSWIYALLTCNVQELVLECHSFHADIVHQLPWVLFSSNTLVSLKIKGNFALYLPAYIHFPCLKLLEINFAIFVDNASAKRLFAGCPILEELVIHKRIDCLEIMDISVPSLKRLRLYIFSEGSDIQIVINTPRLESLGLFDHERGPNRYSVNFTSCLVSAQLNGFDVFLLHRVSRVEFLALTVEDMSLHEIIRDSALPIFRNLKTMKLYVELPSIVDWRCLPKLLECSPNLQSLVFPEGLVSIGLRSDQVDNFILQWPETAPECLSTHLKTVEIFNFMGFPVEQQIVEYLLGNAKVLEKMIIHWFNIRMEGGVEEWFESWVDQLRSRMSCRTNQEMNFERISSTCDVIFID